MSRRRRRQLARCTAVQHADADALVRNILTEIEDTGMAAQKHSLGRIIAAHISAERDGLMRTPFGRWRIGYEW